ncbi:39591_t:CDS:2, partial [Gigaspora margarita]
QLLVTDNNSTKDLSYVLDKEENNEIESDNKEILIDKKENKNKYYDLVSSKTVAEVVNHEPWLAKCVR